MTRMLMKVFVIVAIAGAGFVTAAQAADEKAALIKKKLQKRFAGTKNIAVKPSPIKSLYEVTVGSRVFYVGQNGTYLITGQMWNLDTNKNMSMNSLNKIRKRILDGLKEDNMIVFSPPADKVKHTVTVFTDLDCHYCRLLHSKIAGYNQLGIRVRYVLYPRAGKNAPSYNKAISVWCSKDRKSNFTRAKQGQSIQPKSCPNPVEHNVVVGGTLGIRGTPAIFFTNGRVVPGYVDPARLNSMLKTVK